MGFDDDGAACALGQGQQGQNDLRHERARVALEAGLEIRGSGEDALITRVRRGGHVEIERMTDAAVRLRCAELAERAGVAKFSPHDLRRTRVSELLDAGADLVSVQALAEHSSPAITARYGRRAERAKRRAAEMLELPIR